MRLKVSGKQDVIFKWMAFDSKTKVYPVLPVGYDISSLCR